MLTRLAFVVTLALSPVFAVAEGDLQILVPVPDAEQGRHHFVSKGCVVCHAVNGVGGKAGPALDADPEGGPIAPLDFAARIWRGAAAMVILQSLEFGYQIEMTGQEIADLAAFAGDAALQATFSEKHIPEVMRGWTIDEPFPSAGMDLPDPGAEPGTEAN